MCLRLLSLSLEILNLGALLFVLLLPYLIPASPSDPELISILRDHP